MTEQEKIEKAKALVAEGMMTVREAAAFSGYSRDRIFQHLAAKRLPSMMSGTRRLIPKAALLQLMAEDMASQMAQG